MKDPRLDVDEVLGILRTVALFFGEQRELLKGDDRPSKEEESSTVVFENKFKRANLVTMGIFFSSLVRYDNLICSDNNMVTRSSTRPRISKIVIQYEESKDFARYDMKDTVPSYSMLKVKS